MNTAQHPATPEPIDAVHALVADAGVLARRLREVLAQLAEGAPTLDELIRRTAVSRRTVEDLLAAAGPDVEATRETYRLLPDARDRYRERFALHELHAAPPAGPDQLELMRGFITGGPAPVEALDHVTATPETVLRRAEWLRDNYDLHGAHVLCLGDHDLTSLALSLVVPSASVTVVDVDERILRHIDEVSAERGFAVRTLHADLRFGVPPVLEGWADLVFTDPPYTPEGVGLFATRAAECLASQHSRLLIAYGYSPRTPALGHKVQQELLRLGVVFEAILPRFHRYFGAQAIGSASDLYVCQPTAHTRKLALRQAPGIYTHGPQSVEALEAAAPAEFLRAVGDRVGGPVSSLRDPGWSRPIRTKQGAPVFDLRPDPGPWLLRMLLACNTERAGFLVDNNHPDITGERQQRALSELVAAKYRVRFHRSSPDSKHAILVAELVEEPSVASYLLHRAHGKVGNIWREALIAHSDAELTKREAKDRVTALAPNPTDLDLRLIDLPRHRIAEVLRASARA
ncbi:bis-aminopropyl spermidine synthase family protein [Saccharopolyspora sp. K220]|uniref:bis-aminopropyl spermidine synthase family protein n=1 Tax=Saccharopolyspora soli TaxID=2926618 RepID=UPI001F585A66|nr:bis-aminopropyl spermidine synthase family protein [Saccharopolyspora soli]MCI2416742.1 bis-aminopropyl spermidine synthase family protein [Saccharopolyspora soli]